MLNHITPVMLGTAEHSTASDRGRQERPDKEPDRSIREQG